MSRKPQINPQFAKPRMSHRIHVLVLALASTLALTWAGGAAALPIEGTGSLAITGQTPVADGVQLTLSATGQATRMGIYTRVEELVLDPVSNRFRGTVTFTAQNGDTLSGLVVGLFVGPATATGTYEWTSGTGKFAHPIGSARFVVTTADGVSFALQFRGEVSHVKPQP